MILHDFVGKIVIYCAFLGFMQLLNLLKLQILQILDLLYKEILLNFLFDFKFHWYISSGVADFIVHELEGVELWTKFT